MSRGRGVMRSRAASIHSRHRSRSSMAPFSLPAPARAGSRRRRRSRSSTGASASPLLEPRLQEGAHRADVGGVTARRHPAQVQGAEGVAGEETDGLGSVALTPARLLPDDDADVARAVNPVDGPELDVADVAVVL